MAAHGTGNDLKTHVGTYSRFLGMLKWGAIACAILAAIVVFLIAT